MCYNRSVHHQTDSFYDLFAKTHDTLLDVIYDVNETFRLCRSNELRDDEKSFHIWKTFKQCLRVKHCRNADQEKLIRSTPDIEYFAMVFTVFHVLFVFVDGHTSVNNAIGIVTKHSLSRIL